MKTSILQASLLSSALLFGLAGCGGGGGDSGTATPSPAASKLAAYLGEWRAPCDGRELETISVTQDAAGGDRALINLRTDYYQNTGCTGAVLATERTDVPSLQVAITGSANGGVVFAPGSAAVQTAIDLVSASSPAHSVLITGSAVTHTVKNNQAQWCIDFGGGNMTCVVDEGRVPAQSAVSGALAISGGKLYILSPAGSVYTADQVYGR